MYICWHFCTSGASVPRRCCMTRWCGPPRASQCADSTHSSYSTNGDTTEFTAHTQNWCRYCAPRRFDMRSNHFTCSPYGGFLPNLFCGRSSCTRRACVSRANIPTRYAASRRRSCVWLTLGAAGCDAGCAAGATPATLPTLPTPLTLATLTPLADTPATGTICCGPGSGGGIGAG